MNALTMYRKLSAWPGGKRIFAYLFCLKAPYFGTIDPRFDVLEVGRCVVSLKNRRRVRNHIGTVHAIAMCNMAEAAGGLCTEVSLPKTLRWIPKGMDVDYLKKATTDLKAVCKIDPASLKPGDNVVTVDVFDKRQEKVFQARIKMYVSEKTKS